MKHGQFIHFLIYHALPILLMYAAMPGLVWIFVRFYKTKTGGFNYKKESEETPGSPVKVKSKKRRGKNKKG